MKRWLRGLVFRLLGLSENYGGEIYVYPSQLELDKREYERALAAIEQHNTHEQWKQAVAEARTRIEAGLKKKIGLCTSCL